MLTRLDKHKKTITGDQVLVREINKSLIFEAIRAHAPISRASLGKLLGLVKGTVSSLVTDLIEQNLVYEVGLGESSGGRKPVMLMFNHQAGSVIAADVRADSIYVALTDLNGTLLTRQMSILTKCDIDTVFKQLKKMLKALMKAAQPSPYGIIGAGIGFPGLVSDAGEVLFSPTLRWENVPLAHNLEQMLDIPVSVYNESRAGAVGEMRLGYGRGASDMVYISIGPGVGTGVIMNNELYKGCHGLAGEAGHMLVQGPDGIVKWQQLASVSSLLRRAQAIPAIQEEVNADKRQRLDLPFLIKLAKQAHPDVLRLFTEIGQAIGLGVVNLMHVLNPALIIIGGEMAQAETWLEKPLREFVEQYAMPRYIERTRIHFSSLGNNATLYGAASMTIDKMFSKTRVTIG